VSPKKTRSAPGEITIKVNCCQRGCTLTTKGDYKQKTCWTCNSLIYFHRFPTRYVVINNVTVGNDKWHVVNEESSTPDEYSFH